MIPQYQPPKIHYESRDEYQLLFDQLKKDYQSMIVDCLVLVKDKLHIWVQSHEGPSLKVSYHWACEGVKLWLKLTKGLDEPWCNLMAEILQHVLSRTCKTAFRVQRMTSKKRQTNQQIYDMLLPLMLDEINAFIQPTYWPNYMDPFEDINLPLTPAASPASSPPA